MTATRSPAVRAQDAAQHRRRRRLIAVGAWEPPFKDAEPVRRHVRSLLDRGATARHVARAAGVSGACVDALLWGTHGRPPSQRVLRETAAALMAVTSPDGLNEPGTLIDPAGTRRRMQALIAVGWCRAELGRRLGMHTDHLASLLRSERKVRATTAEAVAALYDDLWDAAPDQSTPRARRVATIARREAEQRGWPPPAAWDDDDLDDPAAGPGPGWQRSRSTLRAAEDLAEDAGFIMRTQGCDRAAAAARLGVSRDTLDTAMARAGRAARASEQAAS